MPTPELDERFDEIVRELRGATLVAPDRLREQVLATASAQPQADRPRWPAPRLSARRLALVLVPACVVAVAASAVVYGLAGSSGGSQRSAQRTELSPSATGGTIHAAAPKQAATPAPANSAQAPAQLQTGRGRGVGYDAYLELRVADLSGATKRALRLTRALGGYVRSVDYSSSRPNGSAELVVRVPVARVQDAIVRFSALGRIVSQHVSIQDVQPAVDRLFRQAQATRAQIAKLTAALQRTTDAAARTVLQARLVRARGELLALERERAQLQRRVGYATVSLDLERAQKQAVVPAPPGRFDRALDRAGRILEREGIVALYALVIVGPLVLLLVLGLAAVRIARRRGEQRLLAG
jgi:hypothetical protein